MNSRQQSHLFHSLDELVPTEHPYRKLDTLLLFETLSKPYQRLYSTQGRKEKGIEFGIRTLVLHFLEDLSDREMERYCQENRAGKWFCQMGLADKAPDHSYFGQFRKRLGTQNLMKLFSQVRDRLKTMGLIREVFTFVDASHLNSKLSTWDDRDKAIKLGLEKLNNTTIQLIASPLWLQGKKQIGVRVLKNTPQ